MRAIVEEEVANIRGLASNVTVDMLAGDQVLFSKTVECLHMSASLCEFKYGFVWTVPFKIVEARDREKAIECQALYDQLVASGASRQSLRVIALVCADNSEEPVLRAEWLAHIRGEGVRPHLHSFLYGYEHIMFDEAWAEGFHRDFSHVRKAHRTAKTPFVACQVRLSQNLDAYYALPATDVAPTLTVFAKPTVMMQKRARALRELRGKKVHLKAFTSWFYQVGEWSILDHALWGKYLQHATPINKAKRGKN